jgi:hypothetical protein
LVDTLSKGFVKQISLRAMIGIVSFALGVALANLMISMRAGSIKSTTSASDCAITYDPTVVQKLRRPDDAWLFEAFQERPLYAMPDCIVEAYSLTWIPSFQPPVVVRVWRSGGEVFIVAKELDSKWRMEIGSIKQTNSRSLTFAEWRDFTRLLDQASYWELPETADEILPNDGAMWIVEGLSSKHYHWVRRRVPDQQFAEICKHIMKLSGLETAHALYIQ